MRSLLVLLFVPVLVSSVALPPSSDADWLEEKYNNEVVAVEAHSGNYKTPSFLIHTAS